MTTEELKLRPETGEDIAFLRILYRSTREDLLRLGLPAPMLENLLEMQFQAQRSGYRRDFPSARNSIVEKNGSPVGVLMQNESEAEFRLVYIALLPEARGKGHGRRLVDGLQEKAARAGKPLALSVDPLNGPARRLYESAGFRVAAEGGANLEMVWRKGWGGFRSVA